MDTFEGFRPWLRANSCGERTVEDRVGVLIGFAKTYPAFPHVTSTQITAWLGRPGFAPWSRHTYYSHLRSFFTFAMDTGLIGVDPMARMRSPKKGRCVPRPLSVEQVAMLLAAARPNTHAWLILGLYAGLRAHEICKLRGEDVTAEHLYVFGKGGQGAFVPTHPAVWALAATMPASGWWFPSTRGRRSASGHVTALSVSTLTSRLFTSCGVEGSVHRARHTFATRLLRADVNVRVVQELLRHRSLQSTMAYCAVDEVERRDAIALLPAA